jgi:hypothetical protein
MARQSRFTAHTQKAFDAWLADATPEILELARRSGKHPASVASTHLRYLLNDHFRAYLPGGREDDNRAKVRTVTLVVTDESGGVLTREPTQTVAGVRGLLDYVAAAIAEMYHPNKPPAHLRRADLRTQEAALANRLFRGKGRAVFELQCPVGDRVFVVSAHVGQVDSEA